MTSREDPAVAAQFAASEQARPTAETPQAAAWFREWFGREYLAVYPHRDRQEARRAVRLLDSVAALGSGARVLDLACGAGRHLAELGRANRWAAGLDLSAPMLEAARSAAPDAALARGDMRRIPFASGVFDGVTSYFTSFGYFDDEAEDRAVLGEVRRVLAVDGVFLLDFLNAAYVRANLRSEDRMTVAGRTVTLRRRLVDRGRVVEKRIAIATGGKAAKREFVERVRLHRPDDLETMLQDAGLVPRVRFGGYDQAPFQPESPRCIVLAVAAEPR